jgi:xanthine dehydrogenase accessory factor
MEAEITMREFYQNIQKWKGTGFAQAMTALDGAFAGEHAIFCDHRLVWRSSEDGFFSRHAKAATEIKENGTFTLEGTSVFAEAIGHEPRIVICGGGYVAAALLAMCRMLQLPTVVIEDRQEFANQAKSLGADSVICAPFGEAIRNLESDSETYFVIMTRAHEWDVVCLREIAKKPSAYIGMMGSGRRVAMVKAKLREEGVSSELLEEIHAPIGLAIGAETENEIAVAVMAELIAVKNERGRSYGYPKRLLEELLRREEAENRRVLATIVRRRGSAPRAAGTKMIFCSDGSDVGTIGGGSLEAEAAARARQMLREKADTPELFHIDLAQDAAAREGMVCGGVVDIFLEPIKGEA